MLGVYVAVGIEHNLMHRGVDSLTI
jgi:hypothetical protein